MPGREVPEIVPTQRVQPSQPKRPVQVLVWVPAPEGVAPALGHPVEAPPSIWSTFGMKGLDSASIELVIMRRKADRHADAGDLRRQQARREMRGERSPLTKA
jgi:hypothetical protein